MGAGAEEVQDTRTRIPPTTAGGATATTKRGGVPFTGDQRGAQGGEEGSGAIAIERVGTMAKQGRPDMCSLMVDRVSWQSTPSPTLSSTHLYGLEVLVD